ncbi:lanthionine synthetase [Actinomadura sp. KC216]|uniref:lanthionine synthetase C family protein n=1 Tax=Actinomadura sp. KC216 TaxID=2530370 RepID=UPI0010512B48|nr:lanthionine synthetase C family protein [Actinomadura sp. KC216]TDB77584.1 lanthionine synthetase [Actinomadura sp. KC216]
MTAPTVIAPTVRQAAETLSQSLTPSILRVQHPGSLQSLATGAAGIALLHIERAHVGLGSWQTAHTWVKAATHNQISADDHACLYFGAPAVAFVLSAADADGTSRYRAANARIDTHLTALAHRRVDLALERIRDGQHPAFAEYDLLHGLTGIGAYLLRHAPGNDALGRILQYLVRLTEPLRTGGRSLPGWWARHGPNVKDTHAARGGHANFGMAHGVAGPLALLAQAMRAGITVDRQADAIGRICAFLDAWHHNDALGSWWPQWITMDDLRTGRSNQPGPGRPSWCYGTPGLARAQQLAAIATGDDHRRHLAEASLVACLSDPTQLNKLVDGSLCHGWAGVYQTTLRASRDALNSQISARLPHLTKLLTRHAARQFEPAGLLEGRAGLALALYTAAGAKPPISGWDTCLMIN